MKEKKNHITKTANKSYENVAKLTYLGAIGPAEKLHFIDDKIKSG
jgi:hypothetical protein